MNQMHPMIKQINEATHFLRTQEFIQPVAGIVLGTGLGNFLQHIKAEKSLSYQSIPHFPEATADSHKGKLIYGYLDEIPVVVMQGRFHYYEGYTMQQVTFPVRVLNALGIQYLLLSNASGGMNASFKKGDLVLINDHINQQTENPLRGLNDAAFGNRFVDMSCPYNEELNEVISAEAEAMGIEIKKGVYVAVTGPNLETKAEYRFLKMIGADMVGMSTVPEVIVANQVGLPCAAISVITDECDPDNLMPVDIAAIIETAGKADSKLGKLLVAAIRKMQKKEN